MENIIIISFELPLEVVESVNERQQDLVVDVQAVPEIKMTQYTVDKRAAAVAFSAARLRYTEQPIHRRLHHSLTRAALGVV